MSEWLRAWLIAFATTQIVEVPIYVYALLERAEPDRDSVFEHWPVALAVAFGASAITHPIVWFVFPRLIPGAERYTLMVALAEITAVALEALWLRAFGLKRALLWSVFANAASVVLGFALDRLALGL